MMSASIESLVAARPSLHVLLVGRHVSALPKETIQMASSL
jgi:anaerobic magnesium-protoporphyrin IX monomethyl ester cyclase